VENNTSVKTEQTLVNLVIHLVTLVPDQHQLIVLVVYLLTINLEPTVLPPVQTEPLETKITDNVLVVETTSVNIVKLVQVLLPVPSVKHNSQSTRDIV